MRTDCTIRNVWRDDSRPAAFPKVGGSDEVCDSRVAAGRTAKCGLGWTIPLINISAYRTRSTGIGGVNKDHLNPGECCFVCDEQAELIERPRMQYRPLVASSPYPRTDALQILQGDRTICVLRGFDDLLGNTVIYIFSEAGFPARQLAKPALRRASVLLLKPLPEPTISDANAIHSGAGEKPSIGISSDVYYSEIHAEAVRGGNSPSFLSLTRGRQVELTVGILQIAFPASVVLRHVDDFHAFAAAGPYRNSPKSLAPGKDIGPEGERCQVSELDHCALLPPVATGNLADAGIDKYGVEFGELLPSGVIGQLMQRYVTKNPRAKGSLADPVSTLIDRAEGSEQCDFLLTICQQFDFGGEDQQGKYTR